MDDGTLLALGTVGALAVVIAVRGSRNERIIATFVPQVWIRDNASDWSYAKNLLGADTEPSAADAPADYPNEVEFDVTDQIAAMGWTRARQIQNGSYEADDLWTTWVADHPELEWPGPFRVQVSEAIHDFFKKGRILGGQIIDRP